VPTDPLPFVIGDAETEAENLLLSGNSSNVVLVPEANIVFGGWGSNRTVTITPAPGQTGIAPIWISVSDRTNSADVLFPLLVTATEEVILCDNFTYPDGSLVTNSAFFWDTRSGIAGQCQAGGGQLQLCATQTEDVVARLVGAPYAKTNSIGLYSSFKVRFLTLPKPAPAFFAHFANGSTLRGRIYAGTTNAAEGCFRLQVANGAGPPLEFPQDLTTNVTYQVVTRYMVDSATTTLWLNPASELDAGISAGDPQNATSITAYGFRQDSGLGATILIDDLVVGLAFAAVTGSSPVNRVKLETQWDGANLWLIWADSRFILESAAALEGPFTDLPGATSPYRAFPDRAAGFFRLKSGQSLF
jgi:hypothetical protein